MRGILFERFVARMVDTKLPRSAWCLGNWWGAQAAWGAGKRVDGVSPGRPQSFRYQRRPVDDCSPDKGGWRKAAEQGAERFMAKWIAAEKVRAGLRHAGVCPNVTERIKERRAQSKRACAGWLAIIVDEPQMARTCILRVFRLPMSFCLSLATLFCFVLFSFFFFFYPRHVIQSFCMHAPRQPHAVS